MNALASILAQSAITLGTSLLTEKFVIRMAILVLEKLVKSTKNDLDDKVVAEVKKALEASK